MAGTESPTEPGPPPSKPAGKPGSPAPATDFVLVRLGLALVRPRWGLALAGDRRHAGRSGSDLVALIVMALVATQLRWLVKAAWLGGAVDVSVGLRAAMHVVTRTVTVPLVVLVVAAIALYLAAGARRELGRAFDLACVIVVPILVVNLGFELALTTFDLALPPIGGLAVTAALFGWCGIVFVLAVPVARRPTAREIEVEAPVVAPARIAGWGIALATAAGLALQVQWIVANADDLRPIEGGDTAPALRLSAIDDRGGLVSPARDLLAERRGRVVIVDFWATWCKPCLASLPHLEALAKAHPELAILAVDLDDAHAARALFAARGYTALTLLADDGAASESYGVTTIPHTVVIDKAGAVREVFHGDSGKLAPLVESMLK